MNSLQLFIALRPASNFVVKRYAFTPKDRMVLLYSQAKSLFGPVIKTKPPKQSKPLKQTSTKIEIDKVSLSQSPLSDDVASKKKSPETVYGSEMYWVLGNRWNKIAGNSLPKNSEIQRTSRVSLKEKTENVDKKTNSKIKTENVRVIKTDSNPPAFIQKPIPLTNEELNNVLTHPLHSDVIASPPTDIRAPELRGIPSVGRVLSYTMSEAARNALLKWKLSKIAELGEQGFAELQQANLNSGSTFHLSLQQYFLTNEVPIDSSPTYNLWESVRGVLDTFTAMPVSVEKTVFHPTLKYKGICDCVSEVNNQLTIIEWKRSERSKPTLNATYDAPLQLCAYLGAINAVPEFHGRIRQGMVVIAYENGKPADVYKMDEVMLRKYWRVWLGRLQEYWIRSRDDTLLAPV